jgi:hypothetical protein
LQWSVIIWFKLKWFELSISCWDILFDISFNFIK